MVQSLVNPFWKKKRLPVGLFNFPLNIENSCDVVFLKFDNLRPIVAVPFVISGISITVLRCFVQSLLLTTFTHMIR